MWQNKLFIVLACLSSSVLAQWSCIQDSDCSDLQGSVCSAGSCGCPTGQQIGLSGSACIGLAPYHTSVCVEDHQCSRLFTMFECRRGNETDETGSCLCQPGHHYFHGRCWPSSDYGAPCSRDEHCITIPRNPYSLKCDGVCVCADGYYERQRGECRKIGYAVGDGCVIDEDCQFTNGMCEIDSRQCILRTASGTQQPAAASVTAVNATLTMTAVMSAASHGVACSVMAPCPAPLECSTFGACVCPLGYYLSENGLQCNAELGSQSTPEQCVGLLAEVIDGICTCPANFFFEENMRDCIKVTRQISDSCVTDENCHTFGAASRCGAPVEPWQLRTCECDTDLAVWVNATQMCRLFAGIGEECEVDSDCLAGVLEIQCVSNICTCPPGLVAFEGLCLTTGLALGDACQASVECTETSNTECSGGVCSCGDGYQDAGDYCAAIIGGSCTTDEECVIEDTVCVNETVSDSLARQSPTCQCRGGYVAYNETCWTVSDGYEAECNVSSQCVSILGDDSECVAGSCVCVAGHHHRDGACWPMTDLFESCTRSSQCYLATMSERTVCRNSICQCTFDYPYSEELQTCLTYSAASSVLASSLLVAAALIYLSIS